MLSLFVVFLLMIVFSCYDPNNFLLFLIRNSFLFFLFQTLSVRDSLKKKTATFVHNNALQRTAGVFM